MNRRILYLSFLVMIVLSLGLHPPASGADAKCALARKIEKEAVKRFRADKKAGLKLFLKAHSYCPDDANLNFNLGLAYYRYGNFKEAEGYLNKAVKKVGNNGEWLNLLAWVMLENRSDKAKALDYAQKAVKLRPDSPAVFGTLIRAYLKNGDLYEAAMQAQKAQSKWPKDENIGDRYGAAVDTYIAYYLEKTKAGRHDEALKGLQKIGFDPDVTNAYCWALFAAGKTEDALGKAHRAKGKFKGNVILTDTFDHIMDRFIHACYQQFKKGKRADAFESVDKMTNVYAAHGGLKEARKKMWDAILEEADIPVPPPVKTASRGETRKGEGARLLGSLQRGEAVQEGADDLLVDVDRDIPKAKKKKPHAIAVIIGNKNYSDTGYGVPDVDYAARDAGYMKEYVINTLGYKKENIIYALNATKGQLERIFGTKENFRGKLHKWAKAERGKSDLFIYYAGHGAPDPAGKGAFLLPVDADVDYILANGYSLDTLYDNLEKIPAKRITVVLDACFSGNSAGGMLVKDVSIAILKSASPVRKLENGVIFASAGKDQVSNWYPEKRHSLFTYFFMKGVKGEADSNRDKKITVAELKNYLCDKVYYLSSRKGREQTPIVVGDGSWEVARLR